MPEQVVTNLLNPTSLITIGAGGISFLILVAIVVKEKFFPPKTPPELQEMLKNNQEVLQNNTEALNKYREVVKEVARSNDNVAGAIKLLENSYTNLNSNIVSLNSLLTRHDCRAEDMMNEISKISERTNACLNRK